jgi:hypothetical protein
MSDRYHGNCAWIFKAVAATALMQFGAVCAAAAEDTFSGLFDGGKFLLDARYRYEHVDQAGFVNDADANTLRIRAGFQTGKVWNLVGLIEFEGVGHLTDSFSDTVNGKVTYPVIADPEDYQVNRLQLQFTGIPDTSVTLGRQRINLDNQRFVGGVAFRQNEQTFDALRIANTSIKGLTLDYTYLNRVNRIFGDDSPQGAFRGDTHLINAGYDIPDLGKLTAYAYLLDLNEAAALSTESYGLRFAGKLGLGEGIFAVYAAEYAAQSPYAGNTGSFDLDYWLVEAGLNIDDFKLLAGVETLEGDGVRGFSTPLATLHKFQGYADVFLTTPPQGIVDVYGTIGYETKVESVAGLTGIGAALTYHDYESERTAVSYGSEVNVELTARFGENWSAGLKYASYDGDGAFADRDKVWLNVSFVK